MIVPDDDMPDTNSTSSSSTTLEATVPRLDMACEISLISSSSRACHSMTWSSPSASSTTAAFSTPLSRLGSSMIFLRTTVATYESWSQARRIDTDSSGWRSTNSDTFLTDDAFTWPSMRAISMRCSCSAEGTRPVAAILSAAA